MTENIFINRISAWAPGVTSQNEWNEWAEGKREIEISGKAPGLSFADPMFRRRLSQLCKMTIHVMHNLMPIQENTKIFFFSFRGEISRQFQVNKSLITENMLSPAVFSLSVFNAAAAQATMALGIKGGYCAIYGENDSFETGLTAAAASLLGSSAEEVVFIYADEEVPSEYVQFFENSQTPFAIAFGILLSKNKKENSVVLSLNENTQGPFVFLKSLINNPAIQKNGEINVTG